MALRFTRWPVADDHSLSAVLPVEVSRCGIYVLEFRDGSRYVGQSVDLLSRFASHRRRWPGEIVAVEFTPVAPEQLSEVERDVIATHVKDGANLRNIDLVAMPPPSRALDLLVDHAVQKEWLAGMTEPLEIGDRAVQARRRQRAAERFARLAEREDYPEILLCLASYVQACLPWPHRTEGRLWVVTSMPSTGRSQTWHRLAVISVNNVEVLVLGEFRESPSEAWSPAGFLNLAADTHVPEEFAVALTSGRYAKVGSVLRLEFGDYLDVPLAFLADPFVAQGARTLAMGLLRKGTGMFGRFHDDNLADDLFVQLDQLREVELH